jgi:hypothetical protein
MVTRTTLQVLPFPSSLSIKSSAIPVEKFRKHLSGLDFITSATLFEDTWHVELPTSGSSHLSSLAVAGKILKEWLRLEHQIEIQAEVFESFVKCSCDNVPPGLGEPCFDKFQAVLCKELLKLEFACSFEIGSGFDGTLMRGSEHNDVFVKDDDGIKPGSNNAGGVLGGITTGNPVNFRVGFTQLTEETSSLVEAISSVVLLDFISIQKVRKFQN